jgi:NADH-quinone oxidoreductase subunit N
VNLGVLVPIVVLGAGALLVLLLDLFWEGAEGLQRLLAFLVLAAAAATSFGAASSGLVFSGTLRGDPLSVAIDLLAVAGAAVAVALRATGGWGRRWSAYLALVLWAAAGMALLGSAGDLIVLFLGVEVLSLALYALTAFASVGDPALGVPGDRGRGAEAGFKYFILGGLGSGMLLYGAALTYAASGSLALAGLGGHGVLSVMGLLLIIGGLGFKLGLAPFHLWTPDVYEGAPTPITAFMSVGTKAAAFAALARIVTAAAGPSGVWVDALAVLGVGSMFVGYVLATAQPGLKRLLAYSGVANAGTVVLALLAPAAWRPVAVVYLAAYAAATLAVFAVLAALEASGAGDRLAALRGLAGRQPWVAAVLCLAVLSLAAVPPTGGFLGKLLLLRALAAAGHPAVAALVAAGAVLALYPYLKLAVAALQPAEAGQGGPVRAAPGWVAVAAAAAVASLVIGFLPGPLLHI